MNRAERSRARNQHRAFWSVGRFSLGHLVRAVALCGFCFGGATCLRAQESETGTFQIIVSEHLVGTERFRIARGGEFWEASGELRLTTGAAPTTESSILRLDGNLRPISYERQLRSSKTGRLTVQVGATETSLVSVTPEGTNEQVFYLPEHFLVILDTNFFHHYSFLIRQYDPSRGGRQVFNVFIPQEALPGTIDLELVGTEKLTVNSVERELHHYRGTTDEIQMDIWATPDKAIQRLWIPTARLEVVRQ